MALFLLILLCWHLRWLQQREMKINKLEGVLRATREPQFYHFKWIFPMWIACLLWLSFNYTTTALSMSQVFFFSKVYFIHTEDSEHCSQIPAWDSSWCAQRREVQEQSINTMRCSRQFEEPNQDRRSRGVWLQMLGAFRHHKQTRIGSKRESNSK